MLAAANCVDLASIDDDPDPTEVDLTADDDNPDVDSTAFVFFEEMKPRKRGDSASSSKRKLLTIAPQQPISAFPSGPVLRKHHTDPIDTFSRREPQPHRAVPASNPVPVSVSPAARIPIPPVVENPSELNKIAGSLWLMLHAGRCLGSTCTIRGCRDMLKVWRHIQTCSTGFNECLPSCNLAKKLWHHHLECRESASHDTCSLCSLAQGNDQRTPSDSPHQIPQSRGQPTHQYIPQQQYPPSSDSFGVPQLHHETHSCPSSYQYSHPHTQLSSPQRSASPLQHMHVGMHSGQNSPHSTHSSMCPPDGSTGLYIPRTHWPPSAPPFVHQPVPYSLQQGNPRTDAFGTAHYNFRQRVRSAESGYLQPLVGSTASSKEMMANYLPRHPDNNFKPSNLDVPKRGRSTSVPQNMGLGVSELLSNIISSGSSTPTPTPSGQAHFNMSPDMPPFAPPRAPVRCGSTSALSQFAPPPQRPPVRCGSTSALSQFASPPQRPPVRCGSTSALSQFASHEDLASFQIIPPNDERRRKDGDARDDGHYGDEDGGDEDGSNGAIGF